MPFIPRDPPPPGGSLEDAPIIPEFGAGWFSLLTFNWISNLLSLGYARALESTDLYKLQDDRSAGVIAAKINASYSKRQAAAKEYNARLEAGQVSPGWRRIWWTLRGEGAEREKRWREVEGKHRPSLALAINDSVLWWFWSGALFKVVGDVTSILSPLLIKVRKKPHVPSRISLPALRLSSSSAKIHGRK